MQRSHARRLVTGLQVFMGAGLVAALVHCGDGDHPPAVEYTYDAGPIVQQDSGNVVQAGDAISFDFDPTAGVLMGDKGFVDCGLQAPDQSITLKNNGRGIVNFTAKITEGGDRFKVVTGTETGGITSGSTATIKVSATPIPQDGNTTAEAYSGTLEVAYLQSGSTPTSIRLHQTARGAVIRLSTGDKISLGDVQVGKVKAVPVTLTNTGNVDVTANLALGAPPFGLTTATDPDPQPGVLTQTLQLNKNGGAQGVQVVLKPAGAGLANGTLGVSFAGTPSLCMNTSTLSVPVDGTGTTTEGAAITLVPASGLNFGQVPCGSTAPPQNVTLTSVVTTKFTPDLVLGDKSPYILKNGSTTLVLGAAVDITAGTPYVISVVPKKMPERPQPLVAENAFGDTMTIKSTVDPLKEYKITQTAKGVILAFNPPSVNNFAEAPPQNGFNFALVNSGNVEGKFRLHSTAGVDGNCNICDVDRTAQQGDNAGVITVTQKGSVHVKYVPSTDSDGNAIVLCKDLPGDLIINGGLAQPND